MIRLCGIGMIAAASVAFGLCYTASLRHELLVLRAFLRLLERIRTRIECFCEPLGDIYRGFSDDILDGCHFTEELCRSGFTVALCKGKGALGLSAEHFSLLAECGEGLGKSFSEEQVRHCERYQKELTVAIRRLEERLPTQARLARTLSVAIAAMTVILLI